jgi:predicted AlkP superfamily pyrophosphatase or phosphodiesterase
MKRLPFLILLILVMPSLSAKELKRPKLVVGIVVDQMRWDYLYRYYSHFGPDGFRRLMDGGFRCEQTFINYLPSYTAPGHTCIYTGSVPAIHGITGNNWIENSISSYCTDDNTVMPVGGSMYWGQMSPRSLLTTTVTDELRLATNFRSRVYGISLKDRSSIYPAGHLANGAYWFDDSTGTFSTSTYYRKELPEWVARFNARHLADTLLARDWKLSNPEAFYTQSTGDDVRYEGKFSKDEPGTAFPHLARNFKSKGILKYNRLRVLPAGNWLSLQLAEQCIVANELGQGTDPDFLCVSLSSTDYAGHMYGPNAVEMEDMYTRLDADLAEFLRYLDSSVGKGQYTVFLTADHGAAHNSLFLNDHNVPAGNISERSWSGMLNAHLKKTAGVDSAVLAVENYQVIFNSKAVDRMGASDSLKDKAARWLKSRPEVAYVVDLEAPHKSGLLPEPLLTMAANGYYASRCGSLMFVLKPGYYAGYAATGTTHGTWNPYDTHIPLIWYGWGIPKGQTHREVYMTDIAATLSALLHIQMPNGCVGKVITEIVR